jgi:predicted nucleic acid-binding protein
VCNTIVFVSAALSAKGPPAALIQAARDGYLDVVVSPQLLTELREVLGRDTGSEPKIVAESVCHLTPHLREVSVR